MAYIIHLKICNPENGVAFIPALRQYSGDTISIIKNNIENSFALSITDGELFNEDKEQAVKQCIQALIAKGAVLDFFEERLGTLQPARQEVKDRFLRPDVEVDEKNCIRQPISLETLFALPQKMLDEHSLYVSAETDSFDLNTIVYLDESPELDEEAESIEIYPEYIQDNNLEWYFFGQTVWDIIFNTKLQIEFPQLSDFIKNLNHYDEHDCFYDFD